MSVLSRLIARVLALFAPSPPMTLSRWTALALREMGAACKFSEEERAEVVIALTEQALIALRAGYSPTLEVISESPDVTTAWLRAAEVFRQELAWESRGISRPEADMAAHDLRHAEIRRQTGRAA